MLGTYVCNANFILFCFVRTKYKIKYKMYFSTYFINLWKKMLETETSGQVRQGRTTPNIYERYKKTESSNYKYKIIYVTKCGLFCKRMFTK